MYQLYLCLKNFKFSFIDSIGLNTKYLILNTKKELLIPQAIHNIGIGGSKGLPSDGRPSNDNG